MEKQIDILDIYLKLYDEKNYRDTFYNITYSEMIQHLINYKIYDYGDLPNQDEIIDRYKTKIVAIDEIEIKKKVFPLILFIGEEFYIELYEIEFFQDLKDFLLAELKNINFDINLATLDEDSYQFENQSSSKQYIKEFNFNTVLEFGFSQPTMGNNQYARFIYFIADKMFFEEYCRILTGKDSFNFLYLTNSLEWDYNTTDTRDKKRRLQLLQYITGKNKLILEIRFLHDLLCYEYDVQLVKEMILNLSEDIDIWKSFSKYYLNYPSRYKELFQPLDELISNLEEKKVDILIDSINIDKYTQNDNIKALYDCFLYNKNEYILKKIFQRWLDYIDDSQDNFLSMILTNVKDLLSVYIKYHLEKDVVEEELKKYISNLDEINNVWFKSEIEQSTYFYKNMSKLFIYGMAIQKYDFKSIQADIGNICNKSFLLKREDTYINDKTTLELFDEYIFMVTNNE